MSWFTQMVEKFKTSWSLITHVTNSLSQQKVQGQKSPFADTIQLLVMCLHSLFFFFSVNYIQPTTSPSTPFLSTRRRYHLSKSSLAWNKKKCLNMLASLFSNLFFQLDDSNDKIDQMYRFHLQIWEVISQAHLTQYFCSSSATEVTS